MKKDVNVVILSGIVVRTPEYTTYKPENGTRSFPLCKFSIGVQQEKSKSEYRMWVNCSAWNENAKIAQRLQEGQRVTVQGSLSSRKDGDKYFQSVQVNSIMDLPDEENASSSYEAEEDTLAF